MEQNDSVAVKIGYVKMTADRHRGQIHSLVTKYPDDDVVVGYTACLSLCSWHEVVRNLILYTFEEV